jgi:pimeloyl-ACP methyl ester carboxylesterase
MALLSLWRYTTPLGLARMVYTDLKALRQPPLQTQESPLSSRPRDRSDSVFLNLQKDVACYVCDNEERERVRSFVAEALARLACRHDVEHIILNTHSNGTVIAFDVLRRLPAEVTCKIKAFVTAGSPLRKYVRLFSWGNEVESRYAFANWLNMLDPCDPVADPLALSPSWRAGQRSHLSRQTLFHRIDLDSGIHMPIPVVDLPVNNVAWSPGSGLRAHNYWDNQQEVIPQLARLIRSVVNGTPIRLCG